MMILLGKAEENCPSIQRDLTPLGYISFWWVLIQKNAFFYSIGNLTLTVTSNTMEITNEGDKHADL